MLKVHVWATTLGGDLLALCHHLDRQPDVDLRIFLADPVAFRREATWRLDPLRASLHRRGPGAYATALGHYADVTIVDNAPPYLQTSRTLFVQWHGFGWKGPDDRRAFSFMRRAIQPWWGDPWAPNPRFRWQCFGEWDRAFRASVSGFHWANLVVLGSAFHDEAKIPVDRTAIAEFYPFDLVDRRTVLLAPTWHYGGIFGHWGEENALLEELARWLRARRTNLILRLHDSWRYPGAYLERLREFTDQHPHVLVKFKDRHPDNTVDLRLADVLITNFSSIANLFYGTLRPTLHVYPVQDAEAPFLMPRVWGGQVVHERLPSARALWKLPLEEHGGILLRSPTDLIEQLERALDDPACCLGRTQAFLDRYLLGGRGGRCAATLEALWHLSEITGPSRADHKQTPCET